jgi:hypothetical protein
MIMMEMIVKHILPYVPMEKNVHMVANVNIFISNVDIKIHFQSPKVFKEKLD